MSNRKPNSATQRLKLDYLRLKKDPVPYVTAEPVPSNILEWHYVVCGPEATPYEGGFYHGKLIFPREFPFKPPSIFMITPTGRFKTNTRLCLSMSDFHPDTWNPAWSVSTILTGLLSFMIEKTRTLGSIDSTDYDKRQLAYKSLKFNLENKQFCELFPETVEDIQREITKRTISAAAAAAAAAANSDTSDANTTKQGNSEPSSLQSCLTNIVVLVGFAAFAFTVKYVMVSSQSDASD